MASVVFYPDSIPIVFASDDYFVPYMSATMQSIMENANTDSQYIFFILHQGITGKTIEMLENQVKGFKQFKIEFINVKTYFEETNLFIGNRSDITSETYFRLVIPELFSQYNKVIYLDGDMICCMDIADLMDIDIGNNWIASTRDILGIGTYYRFGANGKNKGLFDGLKALKNHDNYFLGGLIIFNLKYWTLSIKELLEFASSRKWLVHDQDVLNVLCEDKTFFLPLEYQYTDFSQMDSFHYCLSYLPEHIKKEYFNAQKAPKMIHFNAYLRKPWNVSYYVPYFERFWQYACKTPFIDLIISRMNEKKLIGKPVIEAHQVYNKNYKNFMFSIIWACFLFPWYIYKSYCMVYNTEVPQRTLRLLLKAYLFSPYYVLKTYRTLLLRKSFIEKSNTFTSAKVLTVGKTDFYKGMVSIIIPVYNGGNDLKNLVQILKTQKNVEEIEVIAIDSGSNDGSVEFLKNEKIHLIEIQNDEFSHSKTRNLGAEKASGDILIFLSQDALPSDSDWVFKMTIPIVEYGVVAASCIERTKEGCNIFSGAENKNFLDAFDLDKGDRIIRLEGIEKYGGWQRNTVLNNVACVIEKKVLKSFPYRGEFAEDVDLSIRLLKAEHAIALLSSVHVIHTHDRSSFYCFRRSYIEAKTLKSIVPYFPNGNKSLKKIILTALVAHYNLQSLFIFIESLRGNYEPEDFFTVCNDFINKNCKKRIERERITFGLRCSSPELDSILLLVFNYYSDNSIVGSDYVETLKSFFNTSIRNYVIYHFCLIDDGIRKQIVDALYKRWAILFAHDLGLYFFKHPDKENSIFVALENNSKRI